MCPVEQLLRCVCRRNDFVALSCISNIVLALQTIDSLLSKCVLGSNNSPDVVFIVWKQFFCVGSTSIESGLKPFDPDNVGQFQRILESEIAAQPKLQLHS